MFKYKGRYISDNCRYWIEKYAINFGKKEYLLFSKAKRNKEYRSKSFHKVIFEYYYGIEISKNEVVHHLDKNPLNNEIENLVCMQRSQHSSIHHLNKKISEKTRIKISGKNHFNYGKKLPKEQRQKMSEARKGEKHYMFGKKHSEETKKKMSENRTGKNNPMFGKTRNHSEETKKKMSESTKISWQKKRLSKELSKVAVGFC